MMEILPFAFSGDNDFRSMEALAREFRTNYLHVSDLPFRFSSWSANDPENIRLWKDGDGRLLAWAVLQRSFYFVDLVIRCELESLLLPRILDWVDEDSHEHPEKIPLGSPTNGACWFINVFSDQTEQIRSLESAGYACQANVGEYSWSKVFMRRPGDFSVKQYRIPEGFVVRPLDGEKEVAAYVQLHQETFKSRNMNAEWRNRTLHHPDYRPDLDLVVAAPDGQLGAFCIAWLDDHGPEKYGQIEPLGCHPDFRRYALGRIALAEALRRLQDLGAVKIFVETNSWSNTAFQLYESLGFEVVRDVLIYRKDY